MAGIPHDHYEPNSKPEKWLHQRLPIVGLLYDTLMIPTPKKSELDVDLGHHFDVLFSPSNRHRRCVSDALHSTHRFGL